MGKVPKGRTFATACMECGTEFEFTSDDARKFNFYASEGPRSAWAEVECPLCRRVIEFNDKEQRTP